MSSEEVESEQHSQFDGGEAVSVSHSGEEDITLTAVSENAPEGGS